MPPPAEPRSSAQARWRRLVPRGTAAHVGLLVLLSLLKGYVWIGLLPMFLVADEPAHFDNIQYRAEHHEAPYLRGKGPIARVMHGGAAPEVLKLWTTTLPKNYYRQSHTSSALAEELALMAPLPKNRDTDGQAPAIDYPGLYYRLGVVFYDRFRTSSVVTRIAAIRVLSLLFGLCAVLATYFAARLIVDDPLLALVAACLVALQPMASQQTSAVNNDAGVIGFAALLFFFQVRTLATLPRLPSLATLLGLLLCSVAIVATKPTGYGILPGTGIVLAIVALAHRRDRRIQIALGVAAVTAIVVAVYRLHEGWSPAAMIPGDTDAPGQYGHGDFLAFLHSLDATYLDYLLRSTWGQFGWLDYSMSFSWIPHLRSVFVLVEIGTVAAIAAYSLRDVARPHWQRGALFAFAVATTLIGVTFILWVEHRFRLTGVLGVIQGRNFLFVLPAFAIWVVIALAALVPERMRGVTAAMLVSGAMCFHAAAIITIIRQHYVH